MKQQHANELIEIMKEIVSALHREMGTGWCASTISKLEYVKKKIEFDSQLNNEDKP